MRNTNDCKITETEGSLTIDKTKSATRVTNEEQAIKPTLDISNHVPQVTTEMLTSRSTQCGNIYLELL